MTDLNLGDLVQKQDTLVSRQALENNTFILENILFFVHF